MPSAHGATNITVNLGADTVSNDGRCSLREAITAANTDTSSGTAPGECPAGSGTDSVVVPPGTFELGPGGAGEDGNASGDLDIAGPLTLTGAGASLTTIEGSGDRVIDVAPDQTVEIDGVTITGGRLPKSGDGAPGAPGSSGAAGADGGGVRNRGTLTLRNSTVVNNIAGVGGNGGTGTGASPSTEGAEGGLGFGGPGGHGGDGGGIFSDGNLTVVNSIVRVNRTGLGGTGGMGIGGEGGPLSGTGGQGVGGLGGNGGAGGGIRSTGGTLVVVNTSVGENIAENGGSGGNGVGGDAGVAASTNPGGNGGEANGGQGGEGGRGGGIHASGTAIIRESAIAVNRAGSGGDGGTATGGTGSDAGIQQRGGDGGNAFGGRGGPGGPGGGLLGTTTMTTINSTISSNNSGTGGSGGGALGGPGGAGGGGGSGGGSGGDGGDGGNAVSGDGGNGGRGGAVRSTSNAPALTIAHATISDNAGGAGGASGPSGGGDGGPGGPIGGGLPGSAGVPGAGIVGAAGSAGTDGVDVLATATLANSIAANSCSGPFANGGHNIVPSPNNCPGATGDPKLGPLEDNGGPTQTRALGLGSAAIDAVPPSGADCQPTDARGVARPQGFGCEAGAFEVALPGVTTGPATDVTATNATVTGTVTPNGEAAWFVEYGPTTAYGSRTPDDGAGRGTSPVPVAVTLAGLPERTTIHYRFVATNAYGTTRGADQTFVTTPPDDMIDPRFLSARVVPKTFRVNRKGRAETPVRSGAKRGTRFRYSLSETARVVFTIGRSKPGRRVGRRCVKVTRRNRGRRKCKRYPVVGRFAQSANAGTNTKRFSGRIGRRSLRPGRYRATLLATDAAGNASAPRRLKFRVVRR